MVKLSFLTRRLCELLLIKYHMSGIIQTDRASFLLRLTLCTPRHFLQRLVGLHFTDAAAQAGAGPERGPGGRTAVLLPVKSSAAQSL